MTRLDAIKKIGKVNGNTVTFNGFRGIEFRLNGNFENTGNLSSAAFNNATCEIENLIDVELGLEPFNPPAEEKTKSNACHYCGLPAKNSGFFDEPVCAECGG